MGLKSMRTLLVEDKICKIQTSQPTMKINEVTVITQQKFVFNPESNHVFITAHENSPRACLHIFSVLSYLLFNYE